MIEIKPLVDINGHETPVIFTDEEDLPRWTFDFYGSYSFHRTPKQAVGILRRTWKNKSIKDIQRVHVVETEKGQWYARAETVRNFSFWSH